MLHALLSIMFLKRTDLMVWISILAPVKLRITSLLIMVMMVLIYPLIKVLFTIMKSLDPEIKV